MHVETVETEKDWAQMDGWTADEVAWYVMGPFDGEVPGLLRRIRRILDVSQRGLAAALGVSQSVVARWETGRTSPRASVVQRLLEMARLRVRFHDEESDEVVEPMRDDGARDRANRRYPAHVDLRVTGWWMPRGTECTADVLLWRRISRQRRNPAIRYRTSPALRAIHRLLSGTPDDHPSGIQLVAEADHLDEVRELRRRQIIQASPWLRPPPAWLTA